jgi:hypothetical protein
MLHIVFILLVMFVCLVTMQVHCLQLMLCLFRRKMFFIIKYFQRNYFSEKMIFLKIFSSVWLVRKNTNSEKSPVMRFCHWPTGFQLLSLTSGYCFRIPAMKADIRPNPVRIWHSTAGFRQTSRSLA